MFDSSRIYTKIKKDRIYENKKNDCFCIGYLEITYLSIDVKVETSRTGKAKNFIFYAEIILGT